MRASLARKVIPSLCSARRTNHQNMAGKKLTRLEAPHVCPVCGEEVPRGSLACPECGADHNSGWKEDADDAGGLGLPDEEFSHDEWVEKEFGGSPKPAAIKPIWWIAAIILVITFAGLYFLAVWR